MELKNALIKSLSSYHWNEKSYSNWPSRCVCVAVNGKNNKYNDVDVVDNIIMIVEDTIVLIEETYCLKMTEHDIPV